MDAVCSRTARQVNPALERGRLTAQFLLTEAAGSFGDLGTFVPITVGMVQIVGFDAGTVLLCTGLACIAAGLVFRTPMPIQPMKTIAALAIAGGLTAGQTGVAGLTVGLCMLLMGAMGAISWLDRVLPRSVLRGLQMAVALQLLRSGVRLALFAPGSEVLRPLWGADGLLVVGLAVALTLLLRRRLAWAALALIVIGFAAACLKEPGLLQSAGVTLWRPRRAVFDVSAISGLWLGGLAQIPLTLLNSVFAVSLLAGQLFPENSNRTTPTKVAISVGLMNLPVCALGGMPLCHGSGGLAAQYRFGARTHLAVIIRGTVLLVIGLLCGKVALAWMLAFPSSLLGVFLLIAGVGLASASRCWQSRLGLLTAFITVAVYLATGILVAGLAAGWIAYSLVRKLGTDFGRTSEAETSYAR